MTRLLATLLLTLPVLAQSPAFEVASIKPNNSGSGTSTESTSPGRVAAVNVTTSSLLQSAFGIKEFQISGGPGWLSTDKYDIAATTGSTKDLNDKELQPYLQAMLTERFRLKIHRETKDLSVYALGIAKGGAKLTAHDGAGDTSTNISNSPLKTTLRSINISMAAFVGTLGRRLDQMVIDNTSLPGGYDLTLEWAPDPNAETTVPSLFTALQEQLGLKLESTRGPVEIIVIDNIERPTEN
jgi:uncharacterized protein (TIGR03435 family)